MTLIRRPRGSGPTGTVIGLPVSLTCIPRTSPSVASIAMHRTVFSPRCCATSSTRLPSRSPSDGLETRSALKIDGSEPLRNSTSTTLPRTWLMRPVDASLMACDFPGELGYGGARRSGPQRLGAADDVHQLRGDRGLARAIHFQRQPIDHIGGVVGRTVHRGHPRALLAGLGLQQRVKDRILEVAAQYYRHQFGAAGLDQVVGGRSNLVCRFLGFLFAHRQELLVDWPLRERRLKPAIYKSGLADSATSIF